MAERPETVTELARDDGSAPSPNPDPPASAVPPNPRLEDYLDHVCAPLVGLVPYPRREELRAELRGHLEALVATHEELGSEREPAVVKALRQFGPPHKLARQWACEWTRAAASGPVQPAWRAMGTALASFGFASLIGLACVGAISGSSITDGVRWPLYLTALYLLPLAAGLTIGIVASARQALGTLYALALILAVMTLTLGTRPDAFDAGSLAGQGLELAFIQIFCWTPIGCVAAALGGWLRERLALRPRPWVLQ